LSSQKAVATRTLTVALTGNPNSGKTTIFNRLTGARQRVGNYPGVTVEWKQGVRRTPDAELRLVDLPGIYSLTTLSDEELVARDYLLNRRPDVVVHVVDASNLARNLYLATELLELAVPLILVLNMSDVAERQGLKIDVPALSARLGVPVIAAVGTRGDGLDDLERAILAAGDRRARAIDLGPAVEARVLQLEKRLVAAAGAAGEAPPRWQAIKLLEQDRQVVGQITDPGLRAAAAEAARDLAEGDDLTSDVIVARQRYAYIQTVCAGVMRQVGQRPRETGDRIDHVAMHPVWGVPVFLLLMFVVFNLTFTLGNPLMTVVERGFAWLATTVSGLWPAGSSSVLRSLLVDGIIGGVGGVVVFLPNILLLFLAIAVLEATGYMARAAFVMDRFMSRVGLHGKSFIPLLIGFGCTVPAILATRTLETRRDRLITMLVLPLMSCGARLPIYALIIPAFFPARWQGPVLWVVYLTGIVLALAGARLLRRTVFKGETTPFLMELPPYRMPTAGSLGLQVWTRAWLYLKKAGTVILGASIILWFLTSYPAPPPAPAGASGAEVRAEAMAYSFAGRVGKAMEPVLAPLGFDWRIGTALIGAFAAKEVFVAQMGIVFAVEDAGGASQALRERLKSNYTPLIGFCVMLFCLIATPCMSTIAATKQESGSWRWALGQFWGLTALAWVITAVVYQVGHRLIA
jgi:ferrous iron transport protein B